jgi:hypothetical protein
LVVDVDVDWVWNYYGVGFICNVVEMFMRRIVSSMARFNL